MKETERHFFHDNITNMGEVRACVYFSVIFLGLQISSAKPFFSPQFWCDVFCEDDDGFTTTTLSSEADYWDSWCDECPTRRPRPVTTPMPPAFANPGMPPPPGMPGPPGMPPPPGFPGAPGMPPTPVNYIVVTPPQNGGSFSMIPDPNRGWFNFFWNPSGSPGGAAPNGPPPNATPAPAPPAATPAGAPAAAASTAAPAAAAPPANAATPPANAATPAAQAAPDATTTPAAPPAAKK